MNIQLGCAWERARSIAPGRFFFNVTSFKKRWHYYSWPWLYWGIALAIISYGHGTPQNQPPVPLSFHCIRHANKKDRKPFHTQFITWDSRRVSLWWQQNITNLLARAERLTFNFTFWSVARGSRLDPPPPRVRDEWGVTTSQSRRAGRQHRQHRQHGFCPLWLTVWGEEPKYALCSL